MSSTPSLPFLPGLFWLGIIVPIRVWSICQIEPLNHVLYNCRRIFFILSFFVGYILSFGLVRLRTIRFSARVGAHIECSSLSRAEDVTITNVIIKTPDRKMWMGREWRHAQKGGAGNFGDFWKKQLVEIWRWTKWVEIWRWTKRVEIRTWARPVQLGLRDAPHVVGSDGTVGIVKIVSLSPRVENLNSRSE